MGRFINIPALLLMVCLGVASHAETVMHSNGTDLFVSGSGPLQPVDAERDMFVSGGSVVLKGRGGGDTHVAGFSVDVEGPTVADLYAAGGSVTIRNSVGEDLSAMGFSLRTTRAASVAGNARLMGGTVTVEGPIAGALSMMGREVILNARVGGDVTLLGEDISFGPDALILGKLQYSATEMIAIPERVIAPDRVTFKKMGPSEMVSEMRESWDRAEYPALPSFMSMLAGFLITFAFIVIVGTIFLAFTPVLVERMRAAIIARPGVIFLNGVIGLSVLFGIIPVAALTLFGLPLVPIAMLAIILMWTLGYTLAAYAIGLRVWQSFGKGDTPALPIRVLALALAIICVAILNFIPFVGWMANYTFVLLGIGAITNALYGWMTARSG